MAIGLIGRKVGMTRVFREDGVSIPVSVIMVKPNRVTQLKTIDVDGYSAIQVTRGTKAQSKVNKSQAGHYAKAGVEAGDGIWEFRTEDVNQEFAVGTEVTVGMFREGQFVDVRGKSRGKGHAGAVKRHNFATQDATHGNSVSHRVIGSTGQNQSPGRVFKGKKMAGHLGNENCAVQNLEVIKVDAEKNLLLIKGAIPGAPTGTVIITGAVKMRNVEK